MIMHAAVHTSPGLLSHQTCRPAALHLFIAQLCTQCTAVHQHAHHPAVAPQYTQHHAPQAPCPPPHLLVVHLLVQLQREALLLRVLKALEVDHAPVLDVAQVHVGVRVPQLRLLLWPHHLLHDEDVAAVAVHVGQSLLGVEPVHHHGGLKLDLLQGGWGQGEGEQGMVGTW